MQVTSERNNEAGDSHSMTIIEETLARTLILALLYRYASLAREQGKNVSATCGARSAQVRYIQEVRTRSARNVMRKE